MWRWFTERDFTHVDDIVEGLVLAGQNINNEEYEFGTGEKISIKELAELFGGDIEYIEDRPGDRKTS
jgi:UDP-glucose 4-epimerase